MISFLMPAYKSAFIKQAIESIVNQTSRDWELVVVDDASPEDLESIVISYCTQHANVRYYRNKQNIGGTNLVNQWNHCLEFAKGEWIVMAGDDDLYEPSFCESCLDLIHKYPQVDLVRSRVKQINETGEKLYDDGSPSEFVSKYGYLYDWLTANIFTCVGNYVFRKDTLMKHGGFMDFPCAFCSDIATPISLSDNGVANTKDMLFSFRHSTIHLSGNKSKLKEKILATTKLYDWLNDRIKLFYLAPENIEQKTVINPDYIHAKCVYDYYNQAIKYVYWKDIPSYLFLCKDSSIIEKTMMVLRRLKAGLHKQ